MNKLDEVARVGCILCLQLGYGATPAEIHHIRRFGAVRKDSPVIPLCVEHHRGRTGIHGLGRKAFVAKYGIDEDQLLIKLSEVIRHER